MNSTSSRSTRSSQSTRGTHRVSSGTYRSSSRSSGSSGSSGSGISPNGRPHKGSRRSSNATMTKKPRHILRWIVLSFIGLFVLGCIGVGVAYSLTEIPSPDAIAMSQRTTVYYNDGTTPIGNFQKEDRQIISCDALPDYIGNAIVASENRTFWSDSGIDLKGIARALFTNITRGTRQGGSTITQQYAERYYLGDTKSYIGKFKEALLAIKIAQTQDKNTVLCNYMNTIYFGRGAYGIESAAQAYFAKSAAQLTPSEAALLAGIIPAPSVWDPRVSEESAVKRFNRVISIMKEDKYLTDQQGSEAQMPQTIEFNNNNQYEGFKGYLLTMVKNELTGSGAFEEDELMTGGYSIITTIDKDKQALMQQTASRATSGLKVPESVQTGGMSADITNGEILALYAGDDYLTKPLNNVTQAYYLPGSTMKPFTLLGAVQDGVSLQTMFDGNSPRNFAGLQSSVANYGNKSYGNINLINATAHSVNTVFVDLNSKITPQRTASIAKAAGVDSEIQADSLYNTLGIDGVHVKEITQAYQTIANGGQRVNLHIVRNVLSPGSAKTEVYKASTAAKKVFDSNDTGLVTTAMRAVVESGTSTVVRGVGKQIAGKSGTANNESAVSFVGYSTSTVTTFAAWNPGEDGSTQRMPTFNGFYTGIGYPARLFTTYMKGALNSKSDKAFPQVTDRGTIGGKDGKWGLGTLSDNKDEEEANKESDNNNSANNQPSTNQSSTQNPSTPSTTSGTGSNSNNTSGNPSNNNSSQTGGQNAQNGSNNSTGGGTGIGDGTGSQSSSRSNP